MTGTSTPDRTARVAIDPRIRARRIEVRRRRGRRRLARLVDAGLVLAVVAGFVGALHSPALDVDEVAVVGTRHLSPDAVAAAAAVEPGAPLVAVDLQAAGERVASLAWVARVELHRGIDGVVTLAVTEREPVATVAGPSGPVAVDREGRVLGRAPSDPARPLPGLAVPGPVPGEGRYLAARFTEALVLAEALAGSLPGVVTAVDPDGLVATLAAGGEARFGDAGALAAKLRSLATVLGQVDLTCLAAIDLRLPGSPVLTREEGCS